MNSFSRKTHLRVGNPISLLLLILIFLFLSSCKDSLEFDKGIREQEGNYVKLYLPNTLKAATFGITRAATRAEESLIEALEEEGKMESLWFFAFPEDDSLEPVILNLVDQNDQVSTNIGFDKSDYTEYKVSLRHGKYKFYMLANMADLLVDGEGRRIDDVTKISGYSELESLQLDYSKRTGHIEAGNIPMACMAGEIKDKNKSTQEDGIFNLTKDNNEIYVDLSFLCSKVRYTILFDSDPSSTEPEGFSKSFGNKLVDFDNEVEAERVSKITKLNPGNDYAPVCFDNYPAFQLNKKEYPSKEGSAGSAYFSGNEERDNLEDFQGGTSTWNNPRKRAWQNVIYVPERDLNENRTTLTFTASIGEVGATSETKNYELELMKVGNQDIGLQRGRYYDIKVLITNSDLQSKVTVNDWTLEQLIYALHGPYDLTVDKTVVPVTAGEYTYLHYETESGVTPQCISPLWHNDPSNPESGVSFYKFLIDEDEKGNEEPGLITVYVNPEIPMNTNLEGLDLNYFHVNVGNLYKKIEVSPLTFGPFLNVTPELITIDLLQSISSMEYNGEIKIHYGTNVDGLSLKVEEIGGNEIPNDGYYYLDRQNESESVLRLSGLGENLNQGDLILSFKDLETGNSFWKSKHTYLLTFTVESDYILEDGQRFSPAQKQVKIEVSPLVTDYIIHFTTPDDSWTNPHIYVEQPLTLPTDLPEVYKERAGKTVGYTLNGKIYPALEFDFTFGIAFKGWKGYGGPDVNNPLAKGSVNGGYFLFDGQDESFIADNDHRDKSDQRYFREVHSNYNHQSKLDAWSKVCVDCFALDQEVGICMQREEIGGVTWWTYTLSGVATPGKALIRFNDGHKYNSGAVYPSKEERGIPLFDFPDNEGWIVYPANNPQFEDEMPEVEQVYKRYRIYWPKTFKEKIHMWMDNGNGVTWSTDPDGEFKSDGTGNAKEWGYYYYFDFEPAANNTLWYNYPSWDSSKGFIACDNLSAFSYVETIKEGGKTINIYGGYLSTEVGNNFGWDQSRKMTGGRPDINAHPDAIPLGIVLHLYWGNASSSDTITIMGDNGEVLVPETSEGCTLDNNNIYYYDFKIEDNITSLNVTVKKGDGTTLVKNITKNTLGNDSYPQNGVTYYAIGL